MAAPTAPASTTSASGPAQRRALIVKLGAIGDVIMAIPAAAALSEAGYAIDWLASTGVAPLLKLYPWLHVIAADEPALLRGSVGGRVRTMLRLWQTLRQQEKLGGKYDLVATLYYDRRYRLLSLPVRGRRQISLTRGDRNAELLPGRHHTDEYARLLLDWQDRVRPGQLAPVSVPNLPPSPLPPPAGTTPRVVLVPAGARNALRDDALRRWPVQMYVELATLLLQHGYEVILIGGPQDRWASPYFQALSGAAGFADAGRLIDRIAVDDLLSTLAILNSADVTVSHDTGPLHMAGITATALVSLFGPTDPHGRLPRRPNAVALWGGESFACRPCYDGRSYAACPENACMTQVTPRRVLAEVSMLIEARRTGLTLPSEVKECFRGSPVTMVTIKP